MRIAQSSLLAKAQFYINIVISTTLNSLHSIPFRIVIINEIDKYTNTRQYYGPPRICPRKQF